MNKIVYNLVYNRRKALNEKGKALIQVEAYLNKKRKYFSTNIYVTPSQWDAKRQMIKNHPNADGLNRMLYEYICTIERQELSIWQQGKTVTLEALKDSFFPESGNDISFLSFMKKEIQNSPVKESTRKNHFSTLLVLQNYKSEVFFSELTFEFLTLFDEFLRSKNYHINTIAKHMKHIKRYVNIAINKDHINIQNKAFRKYKIKMESNKHTYLSPEELSKLENLALTGKYAKYQRTLDAFLFCCFTGLRYSDFISLTTDNIVYMDSELWVIYESVKTKTEVRLPCYLLFEGKAIAIIEKYLHVLNAFFHIEQNSNINKQLLKIAKLAGINKRISFHTARHTNATLLIYYGVNITTVQKLLGHQSVKTTQVYTNVMDMTVVRDLEKIYNR